MSLAALDRAIKIDPEYEPAMTNRFAVERYDRRHPHA